MAVQPIKIGGRFAVRVVVAVDRITIERHGDRVSSTDDLFQMHGSNVVVVIVSSTTMAAPLIQFARLQCVRFAIVLDRIKDGDTVDR